jgi:putative intracellular protease/amidase
MTVGVLLFPGFEPLDVVGPVSVFGSVPGISMVYLAQQPGPVTSVTGV